MIRTPLACNITSNFMPLYLSFGYEFRTYLELCLMYTMPFIGIIIHFLKKFKKTNNVNIVFAVNLNSARHILNPKLVLICYGLCLIPCVFIYDIHDVACIKETWKNDRINLNITESTCKSQNLLSRVRFCDSQHTVKTKRWHHHS